MSRKERVAELLKHEISDILQKEINDPRIGFVSITEVEIGQDLQVAKVYVSILGSGKEKADAMEGLESAKKRIRHQLAPRLDLKAVPEIIFFHDDSIERGARVMKILNKLSAERSAKGGEK